MTSSNILLVFLPQLPRELGPDETGADCLACTATQSVVAVATGAWLCLPLPFTEKNGVIDAVKNPKLWRALVHTFGGAIVLFGIVRGYDAFCLARTSSMTRPLS